MESLYYDPRLQKKIEAIELLNDWGFRIIDIDNTLYIVEEFIPAGEEGSEGRIELIGQNITAWIHNQTQTQGLDEMAKRALFQLVETLPIRRRKFSPNATWKDYISQRAHNV